MQTDSACGRAANNDVAHTDSTLTQTAADTQCYLVFLYLVQYDQHFHPRRLFWVPRHLPFSSLAASPPLAFRAMAATASASEQLPPQIWELMQQNIFVPATFDMDS